MSEPPNVKNTDPGLIVMSADDFEYLRGAAQQSACGEPDDEYDAIIKRTRAMNAAYDKELKVLEERYKREEALRVQRAMAFAERLIGKVVYTSSVVCRPCAVLGYAEGTLVKITPVQLDGIGPPSDTADFCQLRESVPDGYKFQSSGSYAGAYVSDQLADLERRYVSRTSVYA